MRELLVISGKGGTGKTSLTASFAYLANNKVLCDADVDAADLHLLLKPDIRSVADFKGGNEAKIDLNRCAMCGLCVDICKFDAISYDFIVNDLDCEGCGVCVDFCPEQAISFPEKTCGQWFISDTRMGPMVHAKLGIAEENSGKLVALVRQQARKLAEAEGLELIITDGPPGVGCPVISSLTGVTAALAVTEPTLSGLHDLRRVVDLAERFRVPVMVVINKYDINPNQSEAIRKTVKDRGLIYLGEIPYDPVFTESMIHGKTVVEYQPESDISHSIARIWDKLLRVPEMNMIDEIVLSN